MNKEKIDKLKKTRSEVNDINMTLKPLLESIKGDSDINKMYFTNNSDSYETTILTELNKQYNSNSLIIKQIDKEIKLLNTALEDEKINKLLGTPKYTIKKYKEKNQLWIIQCIKKSKYHENDLVVKFYLPEIFFDMTMSLSRFSLNFTYEVYNKNSDFFDNFNSENELTENDKLYIEAVLPLIKYIESKKSEKLNIEVK